VTTTSLYEIETSEADDGRIVPAEGIWTPSSEDAADNDFIHDRLSVAGIGAPNDDRPHPDRFVALGDHRWADIIEAAATYMDHVHSWRTLHLYPGDDPTMLIDAGPAGGIFKKHWVGATVLPGVSI
jgi:hypothetical protein